MRNESDQNEVVHTGKLEYVTLLITIMCFTIFNDSEICPLLRVQSR